MRFSNKEVRYPTPRIPDFELVAQVSKTKGLDGQLVALEIGRLSILRPGLEVWIVPPTLKGVRQTVVTEVIYDDKKRGLLIRLEGISDRTEALELSGRYLLTRIVVAKATSGAARHRADMGRGDRAGDRGTVPASPTGDRGTVRDRGTVLVSPFALQSPVDETQEPSPWLRSGSDETQEPSPCLTGTVPLSQTQEPSPCLSPQELSPWLSSTPDPTVSFSDINYGELGSLLDVKDGPAYDIWVVDGPYGLLEIPAVEAYLLDEQANKISLALPKGFIEITTNHKRENSDEN